MLLALVAQALSITQLQSPTHSYILQIIRPSTAFRNVPTFQVRHHGVTFLHSPVLLYATAILGATTQQEYLYACLSVLLIQRLFGHTMVLEINLSCYVRQYVHLPTSVRIMVAHVF